MSKLRQKREERGLSLRQAAAGVGISASTFSRIERGLHSPKADTALSIYRFFDREVPLEDILMKIGG